MQGRLFSIFLTAITVTSCISARQRNLNGSIEDRAAWSERMAGSFIARHPDTVSYPTDPGSGRWTYEQGVMLESLIRLAVATGNEQYWAYVKRNIDLYVKDDGKIETYEYSTFNLDNIATGRVLLALYERTHQIKYKWAADTLRKQLANQPRTPEGGFWHKQIYPNQMWLDGLYMAEPFFAEYAQIVNQPADFDDVAHQFVLIEGHTRDPKTGLLYHAWDASKQQKWANPESGTSPHFWSRALGWYAWALVDVLDYFPLNHPARLDLIGIFQRLSKALLEYRDERTGLWYQVVDQRNRAGNYLEASGSCMFVYAFAKGAAKGYLDRSYFTTAQQSFKSIIDSMITIDNNGLTNLNHACRGAGLGGNPYRDGSYEYYISEKQRTNDFKAVAPFILAALELEQSEKK